MHTSLSRKIVELAKNISILYVEDDAIVREETTKYLQKLYTDVRVANDGASGLEAYWQKRADIVITDILMPKLNGIEMIKKIKEAEPLQEVIIISAYTESEYFIEAIRLGCDAYVIKPINHMQFSEALYKISLKVTQKKENEEYKHNLEKLVELKIEEKQKLEEDKIINYEKTLFGLVKMIERRDSYTAGHSQRVAEYSQLIAKEMGLDTEEQNLVYRAGILHDIGKVATPDAVLLKPGKLDTIERELVQEHVNVGVEMLKEIPMFAEISKIVACHHERYDGKGYPKGLQGSQIHPLAQIMIIADSFDAMTTNRVYKPRKSVEEATKEILELAGVQFDPLIAPMAAQALSSVEISEFISQLPSSAIEEERFAYFYKDRVTNLYNQNYLDTLLVKNRYSLYYNISMYSLSTISVLLTTVRGGKEGTYFYSMLHRL
ncbi:MAG: response regulator [Sulfurimonas sp.]|nr:response regulator [Sulfurimonas sp.]